VASAPEWHTNLMSDHTMPMHWNDPQRACSNDQVVLQVVMVKEQMPDMRQRT
jgi:hypothetical protein